MTQWANGDWSTVNLASFWNLIKSKLKEGFSNAISKIIFWVSTDVFFSFFSLACEAKASVSVATSCQVHITSWPSGGVNQEVWITQQDTYIGFLEALQNATMSCLQAYMLLLSSSSHRAPVFQRNRWTAASDGVSKTNVQMTHKVGQEKPYPH